MSSARKPIIMIGVDAASIDLIRANLHRLPNFRRLLESGDYQPLKSWGTLASGSVWPSFATSTTPGEHGIYHHIQWDPGAMRLRRVTPDWLGYRPFWMDLAAANRKVCVVDVPMTFPTLGGNALEIVSWASHDQLVPFSCNRPDVEIELRRRFGGNPMGREIPVSKSPATLQAVRDRLIACARLKGELIQWLLELDAWHLFIAVFGETHRGGHLLWSPDGDPSRNRPSADLLEVYAAVDASLGSICETIGWSNTTFILFAVHGMARDRSRSAVVPFVMDRVNEDHAKTFSPNAVPRQRSVMRLLRRAVPAPLQHAIGQLVPVGIRDWVVQRAVAGGHDWSRTPALSLLADLSGYVRLNVKEREAKGVLVPKSTEEQRYISRLETYLRELVDAATAEPIVEEVFLRSKLFSGPRAEFLPDLFITWQDTTTSRRAWSDRLGALPLEPPTGRSGNHTADGFAVIVSPSGDFDRFTPLKSVTDLGRLVHAALMAAGAQ
jgi:predicted AlkP superfamily phosphohydrolase/phosphomutase